MNERIDEAARRAGVSTTQLAKAAGVTWAAAKRWRQDPPKGSIPQPENMAAIAEVCGVTIEEIMGVAAGQAPPFPAWERFLDTPTGRELAPAHRRTLAALPWPPGQQPTVAAYLMAAEALRLLEPRQ